MGNNLNTASSPAGWRKTGSVMKYDILGHSWNLTSHIQWLYRSISNSTGLTKPSLWDINRKLYNYYYYLNICIDTILKIKISKISTIAYNYITSRNDVIIENPGSWALRSNEYQRVAMFLENCLRTNNIEWVPKIKQGEYLEGYIQDRVGMHYDMGEVHTNELYYKLNEINERLCDNLDMLTAAINNSNTTNEQMVARTTEVNYEYCIGSALELSSEYIDTIRDIFTVEINYHLNLDHNGNNIDEVQLRTRRSNEWGGDFRRTGTSRQAAAIFLTHFRNLHVTTCMDNINNLRSEIYNNGINIIYALSEKLNIYSQNVICGTIRPNGNMHLLNDDRLKIYLTESENKNNNLPEEDDEGNVILYPLVENEYNISVGNYSLPSYSNFIQKLLNQGMRDLGFRMSLVNPPPPNQQVPGGNFNHPAMDRVLSLFTVLGGQNLDNHSYDNAHYILVEHDNYFRFDGANSTIRLFLALDPIMVESHHNVDNIDDIGPYWYLLGPFDSINLSAKRVDIKRTFIETIVPNILEGCWTNLKYTVPLPNS